jgi:hypothetical protein
LSPVTCTQGSSSGICGVPIPAARLCGKISKSSLLAALLHGCFYTPVWFRMGLGVLPDEAGWHTLLSQHAGQPSTMKPGLGQNTRLNPLKGVRKRSLNKMQTPGQRQAAVVHQSTQPPGTLAQCQKPPPPRLPARPLAENTINRRQQHVRSREQLRKVARLLPDPGTARHPGLHLCGRCARHGGPSR